ncbi:putative sushi domain-containing protein 2, partial [Apostichopus japonicus]
NFFSHGTDQGDRSLPQGNDESLEIEFPEDVLFPYYGATYSNLYIQTNGLISFNQGWPKPQTKNFLNTFPLNPDLDGDSTDEEAILIAPFWADVDTSNQRGAVHYRQTQGSEEIAHSSNIVRRNFPSFPEFMATWVFIVTWEDVSFYDHDTGSQTDPRNTFQAVLITDGKESFVFFFYDQIVWTSGTSLSGNEVTGLTDTSVHQAIIGFNRGNGYDSFIEGFPQNRLNLPQVSNINEPGSYAYQINKETIVAAGCSQGVANFVTFPAFGSILGGQKVFLYGPCWDGSNTLTCQFWTMNDQLEHLQTVNGTIEDQNTAYCVPNPFFRVGEVEIRVSVDGGNSFTQSGGYRILNLDRVDVSQKVIRGDASDHRWYTAGNDLSITWPEEVFKTTKVDIHVLNYDEEGACLAGRKFLLYGVKLYSDIHPLGYLLEADFQEDPFGWAEKECQAWIEREDAQQDFTKNLESCPCTLEQALADTARFYPDLNCNMFNDNECLLHGDVKHCVISIFPTADNSGSKCCYDAFGNLKYAGDYETGVTTIGSISMRAHIAGSPPYDAAGTVPMLSHAKADLIPYFHCCLLAGNCMKYLHRRPTADCYDYDTPKTAALFGDPHFFTFDGSNFTFNGKGDYTLLRHEKDSNFHLYGRLEVIKASYPPPYNSVGDIGGTGLTTVVMTERGATAISVMISDVTGIDIQRGKYDDSAGTVSEWSPVDFKDQTWLDFDDVGVSINHVEGYSRITSVTVIFRGSRIGVNITRGLNDNSFLAVSPILPPELMRDNTLSGLFGNWNNDTKDDLQNENGYPLDLMDADEEDIFQYASTWKTPSTTIFRTPYPENYKNDSSYTAVLIPPNPSELTSSEQQILTQKCADNGPCRFDYLVTRDRGLAEDTMSEYEAFQWALNSTQNGDVTDNPNNFVGTKITFECSEGLTLTGSVNRVCEKNGMYSGSEGINECIETPCGT